MNRKTKGTNETSARFPGLFRRILFSAASLLIMFFIYSFSSQSGTESSALSGRFLFLLTWLVSEEQASFLIRKAAHFSIYLLLGFFVYGVFRPPVSIKEVTDQAKTPLRAVLLSELVCALYAAGDEFHQLFSDGRSGQISDVLLDSAGALSGILLHILLCRLAGHRKDSSC